MSAPSPARKKWLVVGGVLVVLIAIAGIMNTLGLLDDVGPDPAPPAASETASEGSAADDGMTAEQMVDELSALYPLPNPRDTTDGCQSGHENDCTQRITTDGMTVYELADEELAAHWTEEMGGTGDARQAGRFMLLWHEDSPQSDQARDELHARALELADPASETVEGSGSSEDEQAFLDALYEDAAAAGSGIHGFGDEDNLELGYAVCSDIEDGMAPTEVVLSLQGDEETPISAVAAELVGHAEIYLCD